jgi:hypothetical protein
MLLECLGHQRLTTTEWKTIAREEHGLSASRFFEFMKGLADTGKAAKSAADGKWDQIRKSSGNWYEDKDQ